MSGEGDKREINLSHFDFWTLAAMEGEEEEDSCYCQCQHIKLSSYWTHQF